MNKHFVPRELGLRGKDPNETCFFILAKQSTYGGTLSKTHSPTPSHSGCLSFLYYFLKLKSNIKIVVKELKMQKVQKPANDGGKF